VFLLEAHGAVGDELAVADRVDDGGLDAFMGQVDGEVVFPTVGAFRWDRFALPL
jgi:hypothetical protein